MSARCFHRFLRRLVQMAGAVTEPFLPSSQFMQLELPPSIILAESLPLALSPFSSPALLQKNLCYL